MRRWPVVGYCAPRHRHEEFLDFSRLLARTYPGQELHRLVDNFGLALRTSVSGGLLAQDALIGFAIFGRLTPVVLGGAWAYRFWLPVFRHQGTALDPLASANRAVRHRD